MLYFEIFLGMVQLYASVSLGTAKCKSTNEIMVRVFSDIKSHQLVLYLTLFEKRISINKYLLTFCS